MRSTSKLFTIIGTFVVLFLLGQLLFAPKAYVASRLGEAFSAPFVFFSNLGNQQEIIRSLSSLRLENQSLRAQLEQTESRTSLVKEGKRQMLSASVYSTYPFTSGNELFISAGEEHGVALGLAVLPAPGLFLGKIKTLDTRQSVVQTLFDRGWELPVKIGERKIDALLVGGQRPMLTLISKNKVVTSGETVYLASKEFPYALTLGVTSEVVPSDAGLFQEASLEVPYAISDLSSVLILLP